MHTIAFRSVLALMASAACAHPPGGPASGADTHRGAAPEVEVVWPAPPAAARARRIGSVTLARPERRAPWWKTALRVLAGVDRTAASRDALVRPFDVAVRPDGSFVLADPDRPGVIEYARDGAFVAELTCSGHAWAAPMSVAVAEDGAVWVADAGDAAVVRWTRGACRVMRPDGLERPTGIAVAGGRVAVADPPAHRVLVLSVDGTVLSRVGARGDGDGAFNFPTDVAAGTDGALYVVDALNFRVVRLAPDGRWLGAFGSPGAEGARLARPKGIAVDPAGLVYVTDAQRDVALVFRPDGNLEYVLGEAGPEPGHFAHPAGVSARSGRLVVADSVNRRAEIFELLGDPR